MNLNYELLGRSVIIAPRRAISKRILLLKRSSLLLLISIITVAAGTMSGAKAAAFQGYPAGDDITSSLGQFRIVLDRSWVDVFDAIMTNTPLGQIEGLPGVLIYDGGVFTSPVLFDPSTVI